jgi:hypothetical protein
MVKGGRMHFVGFERRSIKLQLVFKLVSPYRSSVYIRQLGQFKLLTDDKRIEVQPISLPYAIDAPFNSYQRQYEPACLPDTRVELLREIYQWAGVKDEQCIFWLNGLAGTGKSTIARTISRRYFEQNRLGASFFFSRGGGDVGNAVKVVTSIAVQLANSIPTLHQYISEAVVKNNDIASKGLRDQWNLLIFQPLSQLKVGSVTSPVVIVIDAVDECEGDNDIRSILQLLADTNNPENCPTPNLLDESARNPHQTRLSCHATDYSSRSSSPRSISPSRGT